jgi:hypothetical protein
MPLRFGKLETMSFLKRGAISALADRLSRIKFAEEQVYLSLALLVGALVGLVVVAFLLISEHVGSSMFPLDGAAWRRFVVPIAGSLITGYLMVRFCREHAEAEFLRPKSPCSSRASISARLAGRSLPEFRGSPR